MAKGEATGRKIVAARAGGQCEIWIPGECTGVPHEWSHRKNRSQGGSWAASNGAYVCHACHVFITEHPSIAYTNGWLVRQAYDQRVIPFRLRQTRLVLLDNLGEYLPTGLRSLAELTHP
jgi:hypothetical protein